jgi:hypothetical protein
MMSVSALRAMSIAVEDASPAGPAPQLSTDYLNRYGEALMLLELVPMDPGIVEDLKAWRATSYREHFEASQLRCTASALAAYERLDPAFRKAFEALCVSMNRLVSTVTALLAELPPEQDPTPIVDVASEALRKLIGRATQFINANGALDVAAAGGRDLQDEIDALFA